MDKPVTSQDILNLANAYAVIESNKNVGGGYELGKEYRNGILCALLTAVRKYKREIEEATHGKD